MTTAIILSGIGAAIVQVLGYCCMVIFVCGVLAACVLPFVMHSAERQINPSSAHLPAPKITSGRNNVEETIAAIGMIVFILSVFFLSGFTS